MKRTRSRGKLRCLLLLSVLICFAAAGAAGAANREIEASEQSISTSKEKIRELQEEQQAVHEKLQELESLRTGAAEKIRLLDEASEELSAKIAEKEQEIAETGEKAALAEQEVLAAEEAAARQKESMKLRIRCMYEADAADLFTTLFATASVTEILNSVEYVGRVTEADRRLLEEFTASYERAEDKRTELDTQLELLRTGEETLHQEQEAQTELIRQKQEEITAMEAEIDQAEARSQSISGSVESLQKAIRQEEEKIAAIEAEIRRKEEEARKKAEQEKKTWTVRSLGELSFCWPVPSSSRITSYFGSREAPVEGASTTHKGIDIGASEGSAVLAAEAGTVVLAAYSESAGNYIMISHGNGIYTVYMHMQSFQVSEDTQVSRGEQIGTVGNTGYSTGPHLHFGIRVDGTYTDPLGYVSP